jgi:imidazole glycerol-phosphate synthase subunit HisH
MTVAVIDYGSGNLHSAAKALERASFDQSLFRTIWRGLCLKRPYEKIVLTNDPDQVSKADRIVLPGVGAFADCKNGLDAIPGMIPALTEAVLKRGQPFLGICVGMQLLADKGLEKGETQGLGWIKGVVDRIAPSNPALKIPHMGWNSLIQRKQHPLLNGIRTGESGQDAYFVHSYQLAPENVDDLVADTEYGGPITAIVAHDNIAGTQFHPEKSQKLGLALLANFLRWKP